MFSVLGIIEKVIRIKIKNKKKDTWCRVIQRTGVGFRLYHNGPC